MAAPKILIPDIANQASFAWDDKGQYAFTSGYGITLKEEVEESPKFLLGLLNSNVLDFYLKQVSTVHLNQAGGEMTITTTSSVSSIQRRAIDPAQFTLPSGYTKVDDPITKMMRQMTATPQ